METSERKKFLLNKSRDQGCEDSKKWAADDYSRFTLGGGGGGEGGSSLIVWP